MAVATLEAIRKKFRLLTRTPSPELISDADIDEYVNTFILYDFPEHLRLYTLRSTFTFYTQPNVDVYESMPIGTVGNNLTDFKNLIIAIHPPIYLAGVPGFYTQQRNIFFGMYPFFNTIADQVVRGDGTMGPFSGNVFNGLTSVPPNSAGVLQNNVIFSSIGADNVSQILIDYPISGELGNLNIQNVDGVNITPLGFINYLTGDYEFTFPSATVAGAAITASYVTYQTGKPLAILYYDQKFTVRPVPDKTYAIQFEADVRPTQLLQTADVPQLEQFWQYIAYGAAKKRFEDQSDLDSVQLIMPEFKMQESLVLRATLTIAANERTQTIYTQGKWYGTGGAWWGGGWPY